MAEHRFWIETGKGRCWAVCSCGWRGAPQVNAGLAGALWDRHLADLDPDGTGPSDAGR